MVRAAAGTVNEGPTRGGRVSPCTTPEESGRVRTAPRTGTIAPGIVVTIVACTRPGPAG